jgi:nucleotide-binding universal stress UspA family protein
MSVAVAHLSSPTGSLALAAAAQQAVQRGTKLTIIHLSDAVDLDVDAAHHAGVSDELGKVLEEAGITDLTWDLKLAAAADEVHNTAETILRLATEAGADLLVIGARRRSPVGKFVLGSVTQEIILRADIPVLVVKTGR